MKDLVEVEVEEEVEEKADVDKGVESNSAMAPGIVVNQAYWAVRCVLLIALQEMKEILRVLVPIHYVNF